MDRQRAAAIVIDKAELPELVHEMTDPRPGGAHHLCQLFLIDSGNSVSARLSLPKCASSKRIRARRFSLELKS